MTEDQLRKARNLIKKSPFLIWYSKSYDRLSPTSIFESIINYGDWQDFLTLKKIFGLKEMSELFKNLSSKKRKNIRPATLHYFGKYFDKYV